MTTHGSWPTAGQPEQDQISESAVQPTQSSPVEEVEPKQPAGRHQITHAQEATLREMFGIQIRRRSGSQGLEHEQAAQVGHGTTIK